MGFSYWECYNLPISYRHWFIKRMSDEINKSNRDQGGNTRAAHDNSQEARALMNRGRSQVPAKLRRFT